MHNFRRYHLILLLVLVLSANGTASAEIVTIHFTGTVSSTSLTLPPELQGVIEAGDPIEGSFTIDTGRFDSDPDTTSGRYVFTEPGFGMRAQLGDAYIESSPTAPNLTVQVFDDHVLGIAPDGMDRFGVMSFSNSALSPSTVVPGQFHFFLEDYSKAAFDTDAIPPLPLDPSTFERAFGQIATTGGQSPQVFINFSVETLTADVGTLPVSLSLFPRTINLKRHGQWVTARIGSSDPDVADIDPGSLLLEGVPAESAQLLAASSGDRDRARTILAKFDQAALAPHLTEGMSEVEVTGTLWTGEKISGTDVVRVINPPKNGPLLQPPGAVVLDQNVPNPFNPQTIVSFTLSSAMSYELKIYDITGRLVDEINGSGDEGANRVTWRAPDGLASGVYIYRLEAGGSVESRRMLLLK